MFTGRHLQLNENVREDVSFQESPQQHGAGVRLHGIKLEILYCASDYVFIHVLFSKWVEW